MRQDPQSRCGKVRRSLDGRRQQLRARRGQREKKNQINPTEEVNWALIARRQAIDPLIARVAPAVPEEVRRGWGC